MNSILIQFNNICIQSSEIFKIKELSSGGAEVVLKDGKVEWPNVTYKEATDIYFMQVYKLLKHGVK